MTVPSSSLFADSKTNKPLVCVVREGRAHRVPVLVGRDDGIRAEVLSGLRREELIVYRPSDDLTDGAAVEIDQSGKLAVSLAPSK